ncbi:MAG: redoxin domain-containing protein [Planctomycetes bacterium]|nr:redoxin domain-containing protein [Planctomycetota bacterium]
MIQALLLLTLSLGDAPVAIGSKVAPFTFTDTRWQTRSLEDFGERKAFVIVFTTVDCPLAKRVLPRLASIEKVWRERGVAFVGVDVGPGDALVEVAANAVEAGIEFPVSRDFDASVLRALRPSRSPEICVLDAQHVLRYRGRVGDEELLGGARPGEGRSDLEVALADLIADRPVARATTPIDGCKLTYPAGKPAPEVVPTFADVIGPLFAEHCTACHTRGGSAPFELETPTSAARHAAMIAEVVEQARMPPWFASARYGHFENERRLTDPERRVILLWAENGAPAGEIAAGTEAASPRAARPAWRIGNPDLVLATEVIDLPASGTVPYRYVVLPHVFTRDTWVEAVEIRPSNPQALHHANLGFYTLGGDIKESNFITGQVPGGAPMDLAAGTAVLIPGGSVIGLQIHHVPTGVVSQDRIEVGLRYPRGVVRQRVRHFEIADRRFAIPPFAPAHPVRARRVFTADSVGIGMFVHMHLRGRDMRFDARYPDGRNETLLLVPNYDFNWQTAYRWKAGAQVFPRGTVVECLAHFDNSRFNTWNPDPSKTVTFGQETVDEMMYGFLFYVERDEDLALAIDPATGGVVSVK